VVSSHYIRVIFINETVPCLLLFLALPTKGKDVVFRFILEYR
jgi:hypothetical protein